MKFKRAITNEQKREIIERLYNAWIKEPDLRLGQLLHNELITNEYVSNIPLFYVEDYDLVEQLEKNNKKENV